ncbi:MAG: DUF2332 domain-containing protein [Acidimicrobiia bacterium]|nr:DUF2332 domain-containing protein [Acidimicrobiia bacterium]
MGDHPHSGTTAKQIQAFADVVRGELPLYAHLSDSIVGDSELLELAGLRLPGQPPANVLLAAVQYLLLSGVEHPLSAWYPEISGSDPPANDAFSAFRDFCLTNREALAPLIRTRRTQTNEVARCLALVPAIATVLERYRQPLSLIEIGASAGLLLLFDQYHYTYGERSWGPAGSPLRLTTELRGGDPALPGDHLEISGRLGIDLHPLDVADTHDTLWLESLLWPGQSERRRRLRAAIEIAVANPPEVRRGEALAEVRGVVAKVAADSLPVVFHSFSLIQWTSEQRAELSRELRELGRPVARIWLEWFGYERNRPAIKLYHYRDGVETVETLGQFHHHGQWLDWGWSESPTNS